MTAIIFFECIARQLRPISDIRSTNFQPIVRYLLNLETLLHTFSPTSPFSLLPLILPLTGRKRYRRTNFISVYALAPGLKNSRGIYSFPGAKWRARVSYSHFSLSFFCTLAALLRSLLSWGRNRGLRESGAATLTERIDSGPLTRDVNLSCEFYKSRSQAGAQLFVQLLYDVHEIKINLWRQFLPPNELEHAEFKRSDPKNTAEGTCVTPTRWK